MLTVSLANAKQYPAIAAGMLSRHKPHPCRQVSAILEFLAISIPRTATFAMTTSLVGATSVTAGWGNSPSH